MEPDAGENKVVICYRSRTGIPSKYPESVKGETAVQARGVPVSTKAEMPGDFVQTKPKIYPLACKKAGVAANFFLF